MSELDFPDLRRIGVKLSSIDSSYIIRGSELWMGAALLRPESLKHKPTLSQRQLDPPTTKPVALSAS